MKFNIKAVKSIKSITTRDVHNFVTSPAGFLTTMVVGGVVLAAAVKVGSLLNESIERRKAREEEEARNTIDNDEVIFAHPDAATGEQPVIVDEEAPAPESNTVAKVGDMLLQ